MQALASLRICKSRCIDDEMIEQPDNMHTHTQHMRPLFAYSYREEDDQDTGYLDDLSHWTYVFVALYGIAC